MALIVISYIHVAAAVLRIRSAEGRKKAFSTCGSHLTVVVIFYGSGIFNYMRLGSTKLSDKDKAVGIFNTVINPMLNPIIYSLRNPDVQSALWRMLTGRRLLAWGGLNWPFLPASFVLTEKSSRARNKEKMVQTCFCFHGHKKDFL